MFANLLSRSKFICKHCQVDVRNFLKMFGEKAFELIKELERSPDTLPPYNDEGVRQVLHEISSLFEENQKDVNEILGSQRRDESQIVPAITFRHAAIERNKRCLLAYLDNRLKRIRRMRWEFGSILPAEIKVNLSSSEFDWFTRYSKSLATYMSTIGDGAGLNLTQDMRPPKSLYIEVKCLTDFGRFELDSGEVVLLKKNGIHLLPRSQCETLIRQGVLEHIG